ncbi:DUF664 domain-containing protein [Calidifontibacter sp. DB0510]|uniref:DUF664 domain-containing protein n=1 Tax=Metallococcus carri TaxID=1656884 RepID=A0A967AYL5_9MICO|nr:DinB family protein [Metallococcus carri]NHN55439.1 DUF664 domain-containing protein [Metallococcus carri]NOP38377.1 DUF664 domain-containing protein [Calidifontibacter sp. DB2511S]
MPAHVPSLTTEPELLGAYINQQLDGIRGAAYGLTEEQAHATPTKSTLSIAALVNHVTNASNSWLDRVEAAPGEPTKIASADEAAAQYAAEWNPTESLAELDASVQQLQQRVTDVCGRVDMTTEVPVPSDAPWWPKDTQTWQVRWVLLHLVEEVARHAGHADIIRESIDGATMYELKAGLEGWPETDWLKPWAPDRA